MSKRSWVRALAVLYPCVTALAVLATGNHFLLDVLGGLLAMAVSVLIVRSRRPGGTGRDRAAVRRPSTA